MHPHLNRFTCLEAAVPALVFLGSFCLSCLSLPEPRCAGLPVGFSCEVVQIWRHQCDTPSSSLRGSSASCCTLGGEVSRTTGKCVLWAGWDVGMGVSPICRGGRLRHACEEPAGPCALSIVYPAEQPQPGLGTPWNWDRLGFVSLKEHLLDYKCKFYTNFLLVIMWIQSYL